MSFKDLPQQMVENTIDQMSVKDMLAFRLTCNENKAIADRLIIKRHKAHFGPTDKNIGNKIKDLVLETVFSKLKSKFSDRTLGRDMVSYGIGDIVGRLKHDGRLVNLGVFKSFGPDLEDLESPLIDGQISVMDRLAVEYPKLAVAIRIATHHYIESLDALEILNDVHPNSTSQYNADILVPNQADIIRKTIFKDFYTMPAPKRISGLVNGLQDNPLKSVIHNWRMEDYYSPMEFPFETKKYMNTLIDFDVRLNESDKETLKEYVTHLFIKKPPAVYDIRDYSVEAEKTGWTKAVTDNDLALVRWMLHRDGYFLEDELNNSLITDITWRSDDYADMLELLLTKHSIGKAGAIPLWNALVLGNFKLVDILMRNGATLESIIITSEGDRRTLSVALEKFTKLYPNKYVKQQNV